MRKIVRARHADPRGAVPPQARPASRRNDREPHPVAAIPEAELTVPRLPLPLGYSLGWGGL
jgi:hypothetical protein